MGPFTQWSNHKLSIGRGARGSNSGRGEISAPRTTPRGKQVKLEK